MENAIENLSIEYKRKLDEEFKTISINPAYSGNALEVLSLKLKATKLFAEKANEVSKKFHAELFSDKFDAFESEERNAVYNEFAEGIIAKTTDSIGRFVSKPG
jgi:hypothetical protein